MASLASPPTIPLASPPLADRLRTAAKRAAAAFAAYAKKHGTPNDPFCDLASPLALPEEQDVVDLFREDLGVLLTQGPHAAYPEVVGDISLLRLLRGREYDPVDCLRTFRSHLEKRRAMTAMRPRQLLEIQQSVPFSVARSFRGRRR